MLPYTTETRAALRRSPFGKFRFPQFSRRILKEKCEANCEKKVVNDIDQGSYLGLACVHATPPTVRAIRKPQKKRTGTKKKPPKIMKNISENSASGLYNWE